MELFKLFGSIAIDNAEANKALDDTSRQAQGTSSDVSTSFGTIGAAAGTMVKSIGIAAVAIGGAWIAAIESSREYRTEMGKLDTAFLSNGHSSQAAKDTYADLNAVLGDSQQAVEAANHLAVLTDNEKDLQTWTNICTGVYATFGASLPIEGLTEAANETAKTGVLTGGLTDALNWAGISEEAFQQKLDACSNEQERQKLIMDTLNSTYSKASEQYQTTNKDVMDANRAQEQLTAAFAEFGRVGEPILTAIKEKVAEMVSAAVPHLENLIQKVKDAKRWIQDNKNTVDAWVAVIIGATVSIGAFLLILNWGKIVAAATNAVKLCRAAIVAFNAALRANPIGLIVSLLAGLVAAFIYLWNNNKSFRQFWLDMWAKIKSVCGSAVGWVKNKFNDLKSALNVVKNTFGKIKDTIADKLDSARDKVKNVIDKIKGFFNTTLKFRGLKMPSIKLTMQKGSGLMAKAAELLGLSGVPKFSVNWNAEGGIFNKPTIFNTEQGLQGVGEAGAEAIAPITLLQDYVRTAVQAENEGIRATLIEQMQLLIAFLARSMPSAVRLDSGALVGELVPGIDMQLADRWQHVQRGNTR